MYATNSTKKHYTFCIECSKIKEIKGKKASLLFICLPFLMLFIPEI